MGYMQHAWFWFGNQGLSYIQLGRAWQIGFFRHATNNSTLCALTLDLPTSRRSIVEKSWSG
jgi:nitric oxide reductase large subunit